MIDLFVYVKFVSYFYTSYFSSSFGYLLFHALRATLLSRSGLALIL